MRDSFVVEVIQEMLDSTKSSIEGTICVIDQSSGRIDQQRRGILRCFKHLGYLDNLNWTKKYSSDAQHSYANFVLSKDGRVMLERLLSL